MLSGAMEVEIDKQGRILVPEYLRDYAGLKTQVVVCGVYNRLEIWAENNWRDYKSDTEDKAVTIVEELNEKNIQI